MAESRIVQKTVAKTAICSIAMIACFQSARLGADASRTFYPSPPARAGHSPSAVGAHGWLRSSLPQARLYVLDAMNQVVDIFSITTGNLLGQITGPPFNYAHQIATDIAGNLYVADQGNNQVEVYPPGSTSPSVTLTDGPGWGPTDVFVWRYTFVVGSTQFGSPGIAVFKKNQNTPFTTITNPAWGQVHGITLDANDNLYVGWTDDSSVSHIDESPYPWRQFSTLPAVVTEPISLAVDKKFNLVVCEYWQGDGNQPGAVDVFAPGASTPMTQFAQGGNPGAVTLNKKQKIAYVGTGGTTVTTWSYPSGTEGKSFGAGIIGAAFGVAVSPRATP